MLRLLAILLLVLASCATAPAAQPSPVTRTTATPVATPSPASAFPVTVTDFQGKAVSIAKRPERIVSIGPSNTEFLFALGAGERIVAVDDFSDVPAEAKQKEKVGGVKPNVEKIVALKPDLVVSLKISGAPLEQIAAQGITVLVVDPRGLADATRTAILLGQAVGADGQKLAKEIQDGLDAVRLKAASVARKRVFHEVDASDPTKLFTAGPGSFIHDLIELVGGANIAAKAASPFPQFSPEEVIRADPEVIVLGDAGYGVTVEQVLSRPGWSTITAVKNRRIVPADPNLVHRPGPRLPLAAETYLRIVSETR